MYGSGFISIQLFCSRFWCLPLKKKQVVVSYSGHKIGSLAYQISCFYYNYCITLRAQGGSLTYQCIMSLLQFLDSETPRLETPRTDRPPPLWT